MLSEVEKEFAQLKEQGLKTNSEQLKSLQESYDSSKSEVTAKIYQIAELTSKMEAQSTLYSQQSDAKFAVEKELQKVLEELKVAKETINE